MTLLLSRLWRFRFAAVVLLVLGASGAFGLGIDDIGARARDLAAQPYKPPVIRTAREIRELEYDEYRDIRFRPERAVWRAEKLPFELMFFPQGRAVPEPVTIHVVEPYGERVLAFDPALFDFGKNKIDPAKLRDVGFNGFRVHFAVNRPGYKDEVLVFQGASYFRALGKGQGYGLSARGLAVDTAAPEGEEFPRFVEFWIERPRSNATSLVIYGLLDSRRVAGAYRFVLTPGVETTMQVTARLYLRERIAKLGLAPLTSMYAFGENQPGKAARPLAGQLRRPRGAVRAAAERLGRAPRQLGQRPSRAGADPDARRDQRQHRRLLGAAGGTGSGPAVRLQLPDPLADRRHGARRPGLGAADAARPWLRQAAGR